MQGLEHLVASRTFLTGMLAAVGIVIAFGPEIRLAVNRIRRSDDAATEVTPRARAGAQ